MTFSQNTRNATSSHESRTGITQGPHPARRLALGLLVAVLLVSAGCRNQSLIQPGDTLDVAYEKALSLYEQEKWDDAASAFETVLSIGRGTEIAEDSQYYLATCYFNNRNYLLAASEFERFSLFYPESERRQEVDYMIARSYYELSPRFKLDQSYTRQAIENFRVYISRYPGTAEADSAGMRIDELRNKLARKVHEAGDFYKRIARYNAAAIYYGQVIEQYPESRWAEIALVEQMEAYILYADNSVPERQKERYELALESYDTYMQLFPRGEYRSRAEELQDRARSSIGRLGEQAVASGA